MDVDVARLSESDALQVAVSNATAHPANVTMDLCLNTAVEHYAAMLQQVAAALLHEKGKARRAGGAAARVPSPPDREYAALGSTG